MSRKLTAAVVALALAGGVYFTVGTAEASNMGFKLERSFTYVPQPGYRNIYYQSSPLFPGLADTARGTGSGDRCAGPPDGMLDLNDLICDEFTDRGTCSNCSFGALNLNTTTCQIEPLVATKNVLGLNFQGTSLPGGHQLNEDPQRALGYQINVTGQAASPPQNHAVIVGSHDPSFAGLPISVATCARVIVGIPYHTMYRRACEIGCGLANDPSGFPDADGNTVPDGSASAAVCPDGIFDTVSGKAISIITYDNEPGNNEGATNTDTQFITWTIQRNILGMQFSGLNFALKPGEGYVISLSNGHNTTTLLPPHF